MRGRWSAAVAELCRRQKSRLLFMTRDVAEAPLLRAIDLLDALHGAGGGEAS